MTTEILLLFTVTTAFACFTPGPAAMLAVSVGTWRSTRLVGYTIAGIALANVLYFALSAVGIAGLLAASPHVYTAIRWLGAGYLIYLGVRMTFAKGTSHADSVPASGNAVPAAVFAKGFVVEVSNPKALLYFSALLPQFITPTLPLGPQFFAFCMITVVLDGLAYAVYGALGFSAARLSAPSLLDSIRRVAGVAFVLAGVRLVRSG